MKKVNPSDLVVGQECYIKLVARQNSDGSMTMIDEDGYAYLPSGSEPIYTASDEHDPELEMLVNVASRIYTDPIFDDGFDEAAKCAADLIAACKNQLKQQP